MFERTGGPSGVCFDAAVLERSAVGELGIRVMVSQDQEWRGEGSAPTVQHAELMPVCFASSRSAADRYCELLGSFGIFALIGEQGFSRAGSPVLVEMAALERASEVLACTESSGPFLDDGTDADAPAVAPDDAQAEDDDDDDDDDDDWDDDDDDDDLDDDDDDDDDEDDGDRSDPAP